MGQRWTYRACRTPMCTLYALLSSLSEKARTHTHTCIWFSETYIRAWAFLITKECILPLLFGIRSTPLPLSISGQIPAHMSVLSTLYYPRTEYTLFVHLLAQHNRVIISPKKKACPNWFTIKTNISNPQFVLCLVCTFIPCLSLQLTRSYLLRHCNQANNFIEHVYSRMVGHSAFSLKEEE